MLSLNDFRPITLEDRGRILDFYQKFPPIHSDYTYGTMICWQQYMQYLHTFIEDALIILTKCKGKIQLRPALGKPTKELERQNIKFALKECTEPPFGVIDMHSMDRLKRTYPRLNFIPHRDFFDYVYLASDLQNLAGKKYIKIRNLVNRFKKRYKYQVEPINEDNLMQVKMFLRRWCLWKDCDKIPLLTSEKNAVLYCINHFFDIGVEGIVIRIDGNIEATAIYEKISSDTSVVHFEKAIPDFDGLYQLINQETAAILAKNNKYINRESDMGFSGLRKAKEKYHPHHMNEVYHLSRDELSKLI